MTHPDEKEQSFNSEEVRFRGWRLLGALGIVILVLVVISAVVDILVIGPLDGRL